MVKILVAAAFYPDDVGNKKLYYIHVRNMYYKKNDIDVTVLNFNADHGYIIDGIRVITLKEYQNKFKNNFKILVCHAANLRNHYLFLRRNKNNFKKFIFFFHGHEILKVNQYYPKPFDFKRNKLFPVRKLFNCIYDIYKISLWKNFFVQHVSNEKLIFVSQWLKEVFIYESKIKNRKLLSKMMVINNSVGEIFEKQNYDISAPKKYDFLTIRNYLDDSKYAVDLVVKEAVKYRNLQFCIIGKGNLFKIIDKPTNVTFVNRELSHDEMLQFMDASKCALMPTREDTQGVMTCEMATYGMPTITSNIDVCKEIFRDFNNVLLADNQQLDSAKNIEIVLKDVESSKNKKYFFVNTVQKEIDLIKTYDN